MVNEDIEVEEKEAEDKFIKTESSSGSRPNKSRFRSKENKEKVTINETKQNVSSCEKCNYVSKKEKIPLKAYAHHPSGPCL